MNEINHSLKNMLICFQENSFDKKFRTNDILLWLQYLKEC